MAYHTLSTKLFPFKDGELYGLRQANGVRVCPPQYQFVGESEHGIAVATLSHGGLALIGVPYHVVWSTQKFELAFGVFSHNRLAVRRVGDDEELEGYVDQDGKLAIPCRFHSAGTFDRLGATVTVNRGDMEVRRITFEGEFQGDSYLAIRPFHPDGHYCGATVAWEHPGMVLVDGRGHCISKQRFIAVWQEHEGLIPVQIEQDLVGWLDIRGKLLKSLRAAGIGNHFESGLVPVQSFDEKWGLMTANGEWAIEPCWDVVESVGKNRYLAGYRDANEDTTVRLIDACGNVFGTSTFEWISRFDEGFALVSRLPKREVEFEGQTQKNFIDMRGSILFEDWIL